MDREDQIYYSLSESAALHSPGREDFSLEEKTMMVCAAQVMDLLSDLIEETNQIKTLLMEMKKNRED